MDGVDLFIVEHGCAANVKVISAKHRQNCQVFLLNVFFGLVSTNSHFFVQIFDLFYFVLPLDRFYPCGQLQSAQPGSGRGHQRRGAGHEHPAVY